MRTSRPQEYLVLYFRLFLEIDGDFVELRISERGIPSWEREVRNFGLRKSEGRMRNVQRPTRTPIVRGRKSRGSAGDPFVSNQGNE